MSNLFNYIFCPYPDHSHYYDSYCATVVELKKNTLCGKKYGVIFNMIYIFNLLYYKFGNCYSRSIKYIYHDNKILSETRYVNKALLQTEYDISNPPKINIENIQITNIEHGNIHYKYYKNLIDITYLYKKKDMLIRTYNNTVYIRIYGNKSCLILINIHTKKYSVHR